MKSEVKAPDGVRRVALDDLDDVLEVAERSFPGGFPRHVMRQFYDACRDTFFVWEQGDRVRAFAIFAPNRTAVAWFLVMAAEEGLRERGIGSALIAQGASACRGLGVEEIRLTVHPENPAKRLYQRSGFREIGRDDAYYGPGAPRIVMALGLKGD